MSADTAGPTRRILDVLIARGPLTAAAIREHLPDLNLVQIYSMLHSRARRKVDVDVAVDEAGRWRCLDPAAVVLARVRRVRPPLRAGAPETTPPPKRAVRPPAPAWVGAIAAPRAPTPFRAWQPAPPAPLRAGADSYRSIPSRVGDERVAYHARDRVAIADERGARARR